MPIVWTMPDGSVRLMQLNERFLSAHQRQGETTADAVLRLARVEQAKQGDLAGLTPVLVTSATLPSARSKRNKWKLNGNAIIEDVT